MAEIEFPKLDEHIDRNYTHMRRDKMEMEVEPFNPIDHSNLIRMIEGFSTRMSFDLQVSIFTKLEQGNIMDKYEIIIKLKESTFSKVYKIINVRTKQTFCMKRIKDNKNFLDQSLMEIYILDYLGKSGNPHKHNILDVHEYFYFNVS